VVRVVPEGPLQRVVEINHAALVELRRSLARREHLLRRIPEPRASEMFGTTLVLVETLLPGVLAWIVAEAGLARAVHDHATRFLNERHAAGAPAQRLTGAEVAAAFA